MNTVLNIAAYKFVDLPDCDELRQSWYEQAQALALKGTVLVAREGVNLFLAGAESAVRAFMQALRGDARLADLQAKESWSATQPFKRLRVKVKREIIRMDCPTIRPVAGRAPALDATTLKRWLDQGHDDSGRAVLMLDTRNAFEVELGSFHGAVHWDLHKFSEFPQAFEAHRAQLQAHTVVSFCTGGIRCEKAALYMQGAGFENVYQLDGGILKYFEQAGSAHYRGRCFVFDQREALDDGLQPLRVEGDPT